MKFLSILACMVILSLLCSCSCSSSTIKSLIEGLRKDLGLTEDLTKYGKEKDIELLKASKENDKRLEKNIKKWEQIEKYVERLNEVVGKVVKQCEVTKHCIKEGTKCVASNTTTQCKLDTPEACRPGICIELGL